jgi:calcineurin-like phosphoesterase family protein
VNKRAKVTSFLASFMSVSLIALSAVCVMSFVTGCSSATSSPRQIVEVSYPAVEEPIVFAHVSDTHFGGDTQLSSSDGTGSDDPEQLRIDGKALMTTLIADIIPAVNPLATIHTGDLVNEGFQLKPWESYRDVVASLSYPKYIEVPGNHDFKYSLDTADGKDIGHGKVLFAEYSKIGSTLGTDHDKYGVTSLDSTYGKVHMIRTNTSESPTDNNHENIAGYFTITQKEAILKDSKLDAHAYLTIVLGHHPVTGEHKIGTGNGYMLDLIANSKVNAPIYLCGHLHAPKIMWSNNTLVVQANTFGRKGQQSSFYLVGYDSGVASAKEVQVNAKASPSVSWPIVMITYPANVLLGDNNPNAPLYFPHITPSIILRAMVFSPASDSVTSVKYRADQGAWLDLNNNVRRVWENTLLLTGMQFGLHTITVRATLSSGLSNDDQITFFVWYPTD